MSELPPMSPRDERFYDLLIARATFGVSDAEARELAELLTSIAPAEVAAIEEAVAALGRGFDADDEPLVEEPMPESLRAALIAAAPSATSTTSATGAAGATAPTARRVEGSPTADGGDARDRVIAQLRWTARLGWIAAAASLIIAAGLLLSRGGGLAPSADVKRLVDAESDAVHLTLNPTANGPAGAAGEVVWSDSIQKGYLRLTGVPANDASKRQYQLWIVDPARAKEPVDGGVFDVLATGEVVIPFDARLPVRRPAAFAITAEQPGGVVVSAGPHLMLAAAK